MVGNGRRSWWWSKGSGRIVGLEELEGMIVTAGDILTIHPFHPLLPKRERKDKLFNHYESTIAARNVCGALPLVGAMGGGAASYG